MAITLGVHVSAGGGAGATTGSVDTSGNSLLVAAIVSYVAVGDATISDSKSNTWTALTKSASTTQYVKFFYVASPTVGTGHTFTVAGVGSFSSIAVITFNGTTTSSPFDQQNGNTFNAGTTTLTTGSVTPGVDGEVLVAAVGLNASSGNPTIDVSFTSPCTEFLNYSAGVNFGVGLTYQIQTTATTRNPTFSFTSSNPVAAAIATFKASGGAAANLFGRSSLDGLSTSGPLQFTRLQ